MKEMELRAAAVCGFCHEKIGNSSMPLFYRVRIERHGIKLDAVNRQTGLTMMLGGSARLAQVMGRDEEMTMPLMDPLEFTVCDDCSTSKSLCVAEMAESVTVEKI